MMNDKELLAHRAANFNEQSVFGKPDNRSFLCPPNRSVDPTKPANVAAAAELNVLFADSLSPDSVAEAKLQMTAAAKEVNSSKPTSYRAAYDEIINAIILEPGISTKQLALRTNFSYSWLCRVTSSDAFQAKLAERLKEIKDLPIFREIEDRLRGLTSSALEILEEKLELSQSTDLALAVLDRTTKALGYGQKNTTVNVQQNFIARVPEKAQSSQSWAEAHGGGILQPEADPLLMLQQETARDRACADATLVDVTDFVQTVMAPPTATGAGATVAAVTVAEMVSSAADAAAEEAGVEEVFKVRGEAAEGE